MKKPDFQQHMQYKKGYKMLVRFALYGVTLAFLIYFIQRKSQKPSALDNSQIRNFVIDDTATINN